ncbi:hypothetical protein PpBr36_00350 [Pyricularia pennisetigena]|uniref:hypothetical protein n=1 Tax=Pyricularia pennisetigena TaxID=1578925 RepID=UPI00114DE0BE|nr:hypothetical protein PpBr36_00350 [Pyricularia pennisetigena]TLS27876.1 hypothetical protein PpBr36_00350 [Pyricularia pennisetigena]
MAPPTGPLNLDVEAISGICGSISIACWVVVFSPQIVENFRRGSADGLSLQFIIIWLLGDVFNILGGVLQGVLPTMIILAIYYTIADVVLLGQCFYYRGFTWRDEVVSSSAQTPKPADGGVLNGNGSNHHSQQPNERTALLANSTSTGQQNASSRRGSWSDQSYHLSPAVPLIDDAVLARDALAASVASPPANRAAPDNRPSRLQAIAFNSFAVLMVCASGVAGWYLSRSRSDPEAPSKGDDDLLEFNVLGQVFGWLCAVLYLGSRVPQILLNYRRKSTEGVSMLFFLFACLGNLTYVLSIFAFEPHCRDTHADIGPHSGACVGGEAGRIYGQYILVNLSWLAGSLGTLLLDMGIFVQFFIYNKDDGEEFFADCDAEGSRRPYSPSTVAIEEDDDEESIDGDRWDPRPLLDRSVSNSPR